METGGRFLSLSPLLRPSLPSPAWPRCPIFGRASIGASPSIWDFPGVAFFLPFSSRPVRESLVSLLLLLHTASTRARTRESERERWGGREGRKARREKEKEVRGGAQEARLRARGLPHLERK